MLLLLAGCATPSPRGRYLAEITPSSITNLTAYCVGNTVEIRYPLRGWNAFAHTAWLPVETNQPDYQCQFAVLAFEKQKYTVRKSVVHASNRLILRKSSEWEQLLQGIFASLTPTQPGHGALLLNQQMETVLYRDSTGALKAVPLESKPPDVILDQTWSDQDFSREALKLLAARVDALAPNQSRFLFLTGADPAFVLVAPRERLLVFLAYPADPDSIPISVPGAATVRVLNELLIKNFLVTAIKNPVTLVTSSLWSLGMSGMTAVGTLPAGSTKPPPPLYQGPGMDLVAWENELDNVVSASRYRGQVQFLVNGNRFFPALAHAIENAKRSVDVMVYSFDMDHYATKVADMLKQISSSVRVRVMMDYLGSLFPAGAPASAVPPDYHPPGDIQSYLQTGSRVQVRAVSDPWLVTEHRKCFIIDSRQAYLGGMNVGWVYRYQWHDLMLGLTGPVVGRIEKDYRKAWALAGLFGDLGFARASLFDREHPRANRQPGDIELRILRTAILNLQIYHAQLKAISRAKRYIYIENAYFNDDTILRELIAARQRGVDVRVILPADSDVSIMQSGNLVTANELLRHGIRVYLYPGMTHVKAAVYDGWACVGSANLEKMSLRISQEMDVAFSDPATVNRLNEDLFIPDFSRARELKEPVELNWFDPFAKALANQL